MYYTSKQEIAIEKSRHTKIGANGLSEAIHCRNGHAQPGLSV